MGFVLDVVLVRLVLEAPGSLLLLWVLQEPGLVAAAFCFKWEWMQINPAVLIHVGDSSPGGSN